MAASSRRSTSQEAGTLVDSRGTLSLGYLQFVESAKELRS